LNPFEIWLVVVLVSAVSLAGFVAMRLLGAQKGLLLAGVIGALVSSTAVTAAMASRSREHPKLATSAAAAAVLASAVMGVRVAVFVGVIGPGILPRLLPPIVAMTLVGAAIAWVMNRADRAHAAGSSESRIQNPFRLTAAVVFGAIYAAVLLLVPAAKEFLGESGVYLAAAISGLADVDAVTIALARGGPGPTDWRVPAAAATVAIIANTLTKLGIGLAMGAPPFRPRIAIGLVSMAAVGAATGGVMLLRA
jgi:uncharacterized membrane protein (DUF4010 family)